LSVASGDVPRELETLSTDLPLLAELAQRDRPSEITVTFVGTSGISGSALGSGAVLGVVDGTSVLIETIPQSSGSHSVAADAKRDLIFVPQSWTSTLPAPGNLGTDVNTTAGPGSPTVGQLICGSSSGCIAVYRHDDDEHEEESLGDIGHAPAK